MTHVEIRYGVDKTSADDRGACVKVDGVDITRAVLAEGFAVDFNRDPSQPHHATVTLRLRADQLDLDMPDAVLDAIRHEPPVAKNADDTTQTEA